MKGAGSSSYTLCCARHIGVNNGVAHRHAFDNMTICTFECYRSIVRWVLRKELNRPRLIANPGERACVDEVSPEIALGLYLSDGLARPREINFAIGTTTTQP